MVNWKTYKIGYIVFNSKKVLFNLGLRDEVRVDYKDENKMEEEQMWTYIYCANTPPFNTWQVGDYIEIDNDKTRYKSVWDVFNDASIVRKVSSSAVVSSNSSQQMTTSQFQSLGNQMMDRAERSGGQMEARWIAREEYRTDGSVSAREFGWRYGSKN